ncbi:MAG: hypothetical protein Q7T01_03640 [bacterium]|nr:hypothetical protein [bacterium]
MRTGDFLVLGDLTYQRHWNERSEQVESRAYIVIRVGREEHEYIGIGRACEGTVTAIELALRDALGSARVELPVAELLAFEMHVAVGKTEANASVTATAHVRLGDWHGRVQVDHPDAATAGAYLLFDAYDRLLYKQWFERLSIARMRPEDVAHLQPQEESREPEEQLLV